MKTTVAILGAGPVGLAAAAHVVERGMEPLVLEQGPDAGHALRQWGHVALFSHWGLNMDAAAQRLLRAAGWQPPDAEAFPTAAEVLQHYLAPLAALPAIAPHLRTGHRVIGLGRVGLDKVVDRGRDTPFTIVTTTAAGERRFTADAVIDCTGTWFSPNPAGPDGLPAPGETGHAHVRYGMPDIAGADRMRYAGKRVAVLGSGHSAVGNLIALADLPGTTPVWLCRRATLNRAIGGGSADQLTQRGALGTAIADLARSGRIQVETGFRLTAIGADPLVLTSTDGRGVAVDEIIVATGFRPDLSFLRELRVTLDPALECPPVLAPLIDPNLHSCGTVRPHGAAELFHPEPGFWIAGMKSYGRAPTFLMATGYEQVRSIVAEIAGDHAAARRVELVLPETGVCSGPTPAAVPAAAVAACGCCGGTPVARADACCARDEAAKDAGQAGCGCAAPVAAPVTAATSGCCA